MKAEDVNLAHYAEGMVHLEKSGLFQFLEKEGRVRPVSTTSENYASLNIAECARSLGFNTALDMIWSFRTIFLSEKAEENLSANYGGINKLLAEKRITKEEADELRKQFR